MKLAITQGKSYDPLLSSFNRGMICSLSVSLQHLKMSLLTRGSTRLVGLLDPLQIPAFSESRAVLFLTGSPVTAHSRLQVIQDKQYFGQGILLVPKQKTDQ